MRRAWAIGVTSTVVCAASAETPSRSVHLSWSAPAGCPGPITFKSQVLGRTAIAAFVDGDAELRIDVNILPDKAGFVGTMQLGGASQTVTAKTCDEVVASLAVVAASALEPRRRRVPVREPRHSR